MTKDERFAHLKRPRAVWAVAAVNGESARLAALHDRIARHFEAGERLVYLGNLIGPGPDPRGAVEEALLFRRLLLTKPGLLPDDIVFLRGAQEEMWTRLHQLQFAMNPLEILPWMAAKGLEATIAAYGGRLAEGLAAAREGPVALGRWTTALRQAVRAAAGHDKLLTSLRRAAFTDGPKGTEGSNTTAGPSETSEGGILYVHAGIDPERDLDSQGDRFWWADAAFDRLDAPWGGFARIVRGADPQHRGLVETPFTLSLDAGAGSGGALMAVRVRPDGAPDAVLEA